MYNAEVRKGKTWMKQILLTKENLLTLKKKEHWIEK